MRSVDYGGDPLAGGHRRRATPEMPACAGLVLEEPGSGFCGAVVRLERGEFTKHNVVLADRHGTHRVFPVRPGGLLHEGRAITLVPVTAPAAEPTRSASGSVAVRGLRARTARAGRIWVEGVHDAELVERVWGHDLRVEGVVVEPLHGVDELPHLVAEFAPGPSRRIGVLVDHLREGSKESRLAARVNDPHVLVTGHPYVDIWEAVRPASLGISGWPRVPRELDWKEGVCAELGWGDPAQGWRRVLAGVSSFRDLQAPLLGAVEQLIDFVTAADTDQA